MAVAFMPKDRTRTEHVGRVARVRFHNPDTQFTILELTDDSSALGTADPTEFTDGLTYRFLGRWKDDPQRGYQFHFSTVVVHGAHSRRGVTKYLCDLCDGIGPKAVDKLWTAYGSEAINKLRDEPLTVIVDTKLNDEVVWAASRALLDDKKYQHTKIDLNELFAGRGFQGKLIGECIERWGAKAAEVVKRNPFRLLNMVSAGFKRCDKLYLDQGRPPAALKRQGICAAQNVILDRNGHTWIDAAELAAKLIEHIPAANVIRAFQFGLRAKLLDKRRDETGRLWLTTSVRAYAERLVVDAVRRLSAAAPRWPTARVPVSQAEGDRLPSEHQVERLTLATAGPVGLFCGSPGTGKTHTLAYLVREIIAEYGREAVCAVAPTGKAAVRMRQSLAAAGVPLPTSTIHSKLIQCGRLGMLGTDADDMDGFQDEPTGMLEERFVIVDEVSMCDTSIMGMLLSACPTGTHVLLIGDTAQLPPVGHGSPLRDLIAAGLPFGELTQVRRNAGQIVHACLRIKNGEEFESTDRLDLEATPPANLRVIPARDEDEQIDVLIGLLKGMTRFDPVWETQVLVARNKGGKTTRKELNERLQGVLNPDGLTAAGCPFRVNDKVICLKNAKQSVVELHGSIAAGWSTDPANYQTVYEQPRDGHGGHREPKQLYVANGEMGRVVAVAAKQVIARFGEQDTLIRIPLGGKSPDEVKGAGIANDDEGRGCNFDLAYAITIHKAQGSGMPVVIVMGDAQAGGIASREWLYTAVSRAEKACLLIGPKPVFVRMAGRVSLTKRKTFLAELLAEAAAGVANEGGVA
jgi:exodeoxyribonuclease V alpha subunit